MHLAAKQLIEARGVLMFPALSASIEVVDATFNTQKAAMQIAAAGQRALQNVVLEEAMGEIRPDVRVDTIDLGTILVEIAVTHFVNDVKLTRIAQKGFGAIEIDLSMLRDANFANLEIALFNDASRTKWLYHPKVVASQIELHASIQHKLDAADVLAGEWAQAEAEQKEAALLERITQELAAAERRKAEEEAARKRRHEELKKASAFKARPEDHKRQILLNRLAIEALPSCLAADVRGALAFGVLDPLVWQTTLFGGLIHRRAAGGQGWVKRDYALAWMRYRFAVAPRLSRSADDAIDDYLKALSAAGALIECKNDFYAIAVGDLSCFDVLSKIRHDASFDPTVLQWAAPELWPSELQVRTLTGAMVQNKAKAHEWIKMAQMLPSLIRRPPLAICDWASGIGGTRTIVLEFMVRVGFLRSPVMAAPINRLRGHDG